MVGLFDNAESYLMYVVFMFGNAKSYLVYVVNLVFDGRSKEGREPPGGDAGPEGRVDSVEC